MAFSGDSKGFIHYIFERYKDLRVKDISIVYEGQITHQIMKALTGLLENQPEDIIEERVMRRVYHVMVESLQNINRHAEAYEDQGHPYPGVGVILVAKEAEYFRVTTGNIVENSNIEEMAMFLGRLNNMSVAELDEMYKKQVRAGSISAKGGAGLGFIDIKRKSGLPLDYHFEAIDAHTSFFIFTSTISK